MKGGHRAVVGVCSQGNACARLALRRAGGLMLRGLGRAKSIWGWRGILGGKEELGRFGSGRDISG